MDANTIVENIIHTFKIKVEKYGGHIEAVLKAEQSIIHVDEMHFTNVIFNLLDNAVKYRREDESLKLSVTTRDVSGGRLEVTVADNGIGIRREDLKKIFGDFYRVPTGNLHDVKGFGLGLAYVNKMVRELGGQITVESEHRARYTIQNHSARLRKDEYKHIKQLVMEERLRILLCEDDENLCYASSRIPQAQGL